ncbi:MAG: hypothetical protein Q8N96_00860 [Methylovulum sp.]|nr:hypothetical protein [Methylovulum sp.]
MNSSQINSKLVAVSGGVCVMLLLVLIGELLYARQAQQQLLSSNLSAGHTAAKDEMPSVDLMRRSEESYADMVARPLFIEGRKPVAEPSPEQLQANAITVKFDWVLNGVYTTTKGLSALFSRATTKMPKDNHRKIKQGDSLDGWKLTEIHKDKAMLTLDGSRKELLLRKPKLKQLPQKKSNAPPRPVDGEVPGASIEEQPPESEQLPESPEDTFENSDNEQF